MAEQRNVTCDSCRAPTTAPVQLQVRLAVYDDGTGSRHKTKPLDLCPPCATQALADLLNAQDEKFGRAFFARWGKNHPEGPNPRV